MVEIDTAIIGAGVVGLAIAAEIGRDGVYVIERNPRHGMETSSRNSEVVHAGIYYPPGSLKARLCVVGRRLMYETCEKHGIWFKKVGKLIIGGEDGLMELLETGRANGVEGLEIVGPGRIRELEPDAAGCATGDAGGCAALYSPESGVVDSEGLMRHLLRAAKDKGAQAVFNTEVIGAEPAGGGFKIRVKDAAEEYKIFSRVLINSAGLCSDRIAESLGFDLDAEGYRLRYSKGTYFGVTNRKRNLARGLVYPVPESGLFLGIHATPAVEPHSNILRFGPDAEPVERIDYSIDESKREKFFESARGLFPAIEMEDLHPDTAGIAPKLMVPGGPWRDFVIKREPRHPGLVNLIGIDSPGLTSSLAIAKHVGKLIAEDL
ncbi:MAG: NAD(P)/FAD-dependent oxidoreductase [bacterium]